MALVVKRSGWRTYVEEKRDARIRKLLSVGDVTVARLHSVHDEHERTVREVRAALDALGAATTDLGAAARGFDARRFDLVVTVGGDGTLLHASHSIDSTPILGVNSAPSSSVGFFCGANSGNVAAVLRRALGGSLERAVLTRMEVTQNGRVVAARVLNDALLCHSSPAATSRYVLELGGVVEEQKSSGFWIGPAAGSTAAQRSAGGRVLSFASKRLQLVVREPYTPHGERYALRRALIEPDDALLVRSKMHDAKMFFDGPNDVADVRFGDVIEFRRSGQSLTLLGISARRTWGKR